VNDPPENPRSRRRSQYLIGSDRNLYRVAYRHFSSVEHLVGTYLIHGPGMNMRDDHFKLDVLGLACALDDHFKLDVLGLACALEGFEPYHGEQPNEAS
jgi:hypothetical protein